MKILKDAPFLRPFAKIAIGRFVVGKTCRPLRWCIGQEGFQAMDDSIEEHGVKDCREGISDVKYGICSPIRVLTAVALDDAVVGFKILEARGISVIVARRICMNSGAHG